MIDREKKKFCALRGRHISTSHLCSLPSPVKPPFQISKSPHSLIYTSTYVVPFSDRLSAKDVVTFGKVMDYAYHGEGGKVDKEGEEIYCKN